VPKHERKSVYDDFGGCSSQASWKQKEEDTDMKIDIDLTKQDATKVKSVLETNREISTLQMSSDTNESAPQPSNSKEIPTFLYVHHTFLLCFNQLSFKKTTFRRGQNCS
jgi:hypothetical protein